MRRFVLVVALLAVCAILPNHSSVGAGSDNALGIADLPCGTKLTPEDVAAFKARGTLSAPTLPPTAPGAAYAFCLPIAAHIVRTDEGTGGLPLGQLGQGIADCNTAYINTGMHFVLLSIDYIDDDDYYYNIDTDAEIDALIQENVVANAINVYFTPNLENEDGGLCGRGSFTTSTPQGVAMNNGCTGLPTNNSTFPHELGHFFDLFHTHETAFGAELVDGSNCGSAGDLLCDTPADPGLDEGTNVTSYPGCTYNGSETDGNGDSYSPDTHALMSYAPKLCRDEFSPSSETKVLITLLLLRPELLTLGCPPEADAGDNIIAECTSPTTTSVQLDGTGSSDQDGDGLTYAWSAPGVVFDNAALAQPTGGFSMGTTTARLIVNDGTYNDTDYVDVTVEDTTPPDITCPGNITVECSDHCGTPKDDSQLTDFFAAAGATDICDTSPTITNDAPDCFDMGTTTFRFYATDDDGNQSSCEVEVTVEDTTPPVIDVSLERDVLWPPNHKMVEICDTVVVTDICDPNPTFVLTSIESDEPDNTIGDGNTTGDIDADTGTDATCFSLRSERMGGEDGRVYTIIYTASDESGNTADDTVYVRVPHDHSSGGFASIGFNPAGTAVVTGARQFVLVIPSSAGLSAGDVKASSVYLGNTAGVARATSLHEVDVNKDGREDLALFFDAGVLSRFTAASDVIVGGDPTLTPIDARQSDGPVGIHFVSPTGADYLIGDIFALGAPVVLPIFAVDPPKPIDRGIPTDQVAATGLSSIHPNPFNPQTTVEFALSSPEHVRVFIYDVRGSLVRRLVDETMPTGQHSAVWNGIDDAGRPATSGIYFVRMIAGRYEQTRKIVMLK